MGELVERSSNEHVNYKPESLRKPLPGAANQRKKHPIWHVSVCLALPPSGRHVNRTNLSRDDVLRPLRFGVLLVLAHNLAKQLVAIEVYKGNYLSSTKEVLELSFLCAAPASCGTGPRGGSVCTKVGLHPERAREVYHLDPFSVLLHQRLTKNQT